MFSGERPEFGSGANWRHHGPRFGSGNVFSGEKPEFGSGDRPGFNDRNDKFGSGENMTGNINKLSNKIEGFAAMVENMSDDNLQTVLTKVKDLISKTSKTTTLTFLNAIKALIEGNIGK